MESISATERMRLMWVWSDMKRRCHRESHHAYANYGGLNKREYRNNTSGERNIAQERKMARGREYVYWRVRIRRGGEIVAHARFRSLEDAIRYRDKAEEECRHG